MVRKSVSVFSISILFIVGIFWLPCCSSKYEEGFGDSRLLQQVPVDYSIEMILDDDKTLSFGRPSSVALSESEAMRLVFHDTISYITVGASPGSLSSALPFIRISDTLLLPGFSLDFDFKKWFCEEIEFKNGVKFKASFLWIRFDSPNHRMGRITVYPENFDCDK